MTKRLHISAIIPDNLYVPRDADRKLEDIMLRMSKPAYISVARQMGKTNLLIHAKRKLENDLNRFVFIDITNQFETSQDCFRYIVDQILDANDEIEEFNQASLEIREKRSPLTNNATKEYQDELRTILKFYKGNLVVFLDEVDDLRKHDFSDEIFAQIRKNYFIRVTYPVFERLSYVLSGVIDPEKLIKNKDNSPFNIAIPVYLDDFNLIEFQELISKSEMKLSADIITYIYDWVKGNPRMSFDILSKIEDEYLLSRPITPELIDDIIINTYLLNYKHPPIDHIRDLVKHNTDIRTAVVKLKRGQANELSDDVKNKLYLYGIIGSKIRSNTIKMKNRIVELSLSDDWLEQIELEKAGYFELGIDKISQGLYDEGLKYLNEYIQNSPKGKSVPLAKYYIGQAYHRKEQYQLSNEYLLEKPISIDIYPTFYYSQALYIATNFLRLGEFNDALVYFDEIINNCKNDVALIPAYLYKGECLIARKDYDVHELDVIYSKALELIDLRQSEENLEFLCGIYYRLGFLKVGHNKEKAIDYFTKSLEYAKEEEKPHILLYLNLSYSDQLDKQRRNFLGIADLIISKKLKYSKAETAIPFSEYHTFICLTSLLEFDDIREFDDLLEYAKAFLNTGNFDDDDFFEAIAKFAIEIGKPKVAVKLYRRIVDLSQISLKLKAKAHLNIGLDASNGRESTFGMQNLMKYVSLFDQFDNFGESVKENDLTAFTTVISSLRKQNKLKESYAVSKIIEAHYNSELPYEIRSLFVVVYFFIMDFLSYSGQIIEARKYAQSNIGLINEMKTLSLEFTYVDKKLLTELEEITQRFLKLSDNALHKIVPFRSQREKGRNEWVKVKYSNGVEVSGKYKKFIDDIEKGNCRLIE